MSEYIIKSYKEGFEEEQEEVGVKVAQDWINAHQTPADRLKEVYSQPEFDPETRHYCFKGDKMVGFLTSKVLKEEELSIPSRINGDTFNLPCIRIQSQIKEVNYEHGFHR